MTRTWAVVYRNSDGTVFRSEGWAEAAARRFVADATARAGRKVTSKTDPRFTPAPVAVMVRDCTCEWRVA